jgi:UPF0755 protein
MVEPAGVIPPRPGEPPARRRPPRRTVVMRRLVAALLLLCGLALVAWVLSAAVGSSGEATPPATTAAPAPKPLRIVFPEGMSRREMAQRVGAVRKIAIEKRKVKPALTRLAYLRATNQAKVPPGFRRDAKGIEGFLFPSTYEFLQGTTATLLVADQLEQFDGNWAKVDLAAAKRKHLTPYDVLIIASMVEKETVAPDERPLVAAVIYNRLKARMPLGIDATIRYGLDVPGTEPLRVSHLESDNPYNTRKRLGLPPTPIANPGLASMQAAAHPAKVDYLFFVRKPDMVHHFFTASESEFYAKACEYGFGCG